MHAPIGRTDWDPNRFGYSHLRNVVYYHEVRNEADQVIHAPIYASIADTSSTKWVAIDGVERRVCRLYQSKSGRLFPPFPPMTAVLLSSIGAGTAPAYGLARLGMVLLRAPIRGWGESWAHFKRTLFLMVEYFFAHLATVLEALFVSSDPLNGRQWVERVEQQLNEGIDFPHSWWVLLGPQRHFSIHNPAFYVMGCYQSDAVGILDDRDNVVGVTSYGGTMTGTGNDPTHGVITGAFKIIESTQFKPRPWIRWAQSLSPTIDWSQSQLSFV